MTAKIRYIPILVFIFSIVSIRFLLTDNGFFNVPFLALAGLSPILMFRQFYQKLRSYDLLLYAMWVLMLSFSLFYVKSFSIYTIGFTLFFIFSYQSFMRGVENEYISFDTYLRTVKCLLLAYWIVLVIQDICIITGMPVFNLINPNVSGFKLNSLAMEPSQTSRYVFLLMLVLLFLREQQTRTRYNMQMFKQDIWYWLAFFYCMLLMGSVSAIMSIPLFFLRFLNKRNIIYLMLAFVVLFAVGSYFSEYKVVQRSFKTFSAVTTFDERSIILADGSGSTRLAPIVTYIKNADITSPQFWFGYGMDGDKEVLAAAIRRVSTALPKGMSIGGIVATFTNFGFICAALFFVFLFRCCYIKRYGTDFVLIFLIVITPSGLNTLITWAAIMSMSANKLFLRRLTATTAVKANDK